MDAERATNPKNLAKVIDSTWDITKVLQRLIAHFDEYTDVFEGEELSLDMVRNWHQQEIAKARLAEWEQFGEFLCDADKRSLCKNFLDLYLIHGDRLSQTLKEHKELNEQPRPTKPS